MMQEGLVYYLLDATRREQRIKIGYTTGLAQRLLDLSKKTMCRQTPIVLALEAGNLDTESERHMQFAEHRLIGEWFDPTPPLMAWIAGMEHPVAYLSDRPHLWAHARGWQQFTGWNPVRVPVVNEDGLIVVDL